MEKSILEAKAERYVGGPKLDDEMFQTYRQGGGLDTDTDTGRKVIPIGLRNRLIYDVL